VPTLRRDGVALVYHEAGRGSPPLLFVHGWACDRAFFAPQIEQFSRRHRTIAVDLRGHGDSDKPDQPYTMAGFADDLVWLCEQAGVQKPVVIGHSMGAAVALLLSASHADRVSGIVMIDGGTRLQGAAATRPDSGLPVDIDFSGPDYQLVARRIVEPMFSPSADPSLRTWITERMLSTPRHVLASARQHLLTTDAAPSASACTVPALYIQAATPRPELEHFRTLCPQLVIGRTVGAGHFNMLEVPDQVNAMIGRFLQISGLGGNGDT
jgi:pimeloyl-ACP methyl ester carboxylesterase